MKKRLLVCLLAGLICTQGHADIRLDALLQQGVSEYEYENYQLAFEHFSAALTHAVNADLSLMYPGVYLCAIWHHGRGVETNHERAETACRLTHGNLAGYQLNLFRDVLERNGGEQSPLPHKKALRDAASALGWYMQRKGLN